MKSVNVKKAFVWDANVLFDRQSSTYRIQDVNNMHRSELRKIIKKNCKPHTSSEATLVE